MLQSKAKWKEMKLESGHELVKDVPIELSPMVEKLLLQRDITAASEAKRFLTPDLDYLHDPKQLKDIDKAAARIQQAVANQEKILVFGDYDADGVTSTALLIKTLKELNAECDYYIPNRFTEGYGPNENAFRKANENGFTLIITVDTGITALHEANVAKQLGIDLIITDHHEPQNELPEAFAIIHPILSDEYPFKQLAGVGVAFKLAEYLLGYFPKHLLEYAAIGTIADLVPLKDENRVLAYYGLQSLTGSHTPGLQALKNICGIEGKVSEEDVGFMIGPRLNAVGRLRDASLAVELLLSESLEEAGELAEEIDSINQERQKIVSEIVVEAEKLVHTSKLGVIIVAKEGWNEGVLGIVASKLVQKFDRPAIVLTTKPETGELKGSARSIPAFDLFTNCMKVRDLFTNFGGHAQAAGMTFPSENLEMIQDSLDQFISEELTAEDFKQEIIVSGAVDIKEVNENLIDEINQLAPFGMGNPKPIIKIHEVPSDVRQIGSKKNHLKLQFKKEGSILDGIAFGMGPLFHTISPNTPLEVVGELGINEWNGNRKAQIIVRDMRIDEWQLFDYRGRKNYDLSILSNERTLAITGSPLTEYQQWNQIDYGTDISMLENVENLVVFDLPNRLEELEGIIQHTKPVNIYTCYHLQDSTYLTPFPTREDFIWFYALIRKRKVTDLKTEIQAIMKAKSWTRDRVIFIAQVFSELEFVKIEDGVIQIHPVPEKRDLEDSTVYQDRLRRGEMEQQLYYSNYQQLKSWFRQYMNYLDESKEEMINGL